MRTFLFLMVLAMLASCSSSKIAGTVSPWNKDGIRATGNEPFWTVELSGDSATFGRLGFPTYKTLLPAANLNTKDSLRYLLTFKEYLFLDVLMVNIPCTDDMSGYQKRFTTSVMITEDGIRTALRGCADYLSQYKKGIEVKEN